MKHKKTVFSITHSSPPILFKTQISYWHRLCVIIIFFLSVWSELEQAVPPLLRHLAGILDSQQDPSVRHKKLSSISCSEKLCGFADDLLSRVIQYISSSQTILSNTFIVVKPCSAQLSKLYSRVTNKILIRKVLHSSWSGFTYDLSKNQPLKEQMWGLGLKKKNQGDVYKNENIDHQVIADFWSPFNPPVM